MVSVLTLTATQTNHTHQILVGVLRHYVTQLLVSAPKRQSLAVIREQYVPPFSDFTQLTSP